MPNVGILIPTYLLIFPEKNHGILAGKYDLSSGMIRVEANSYHKRFRSFVVRAKLFLFFLFLPPLDPFPFALDATEPFVGWKYIGLIFVKWHQKRHERQ